jgi:hypothetical protein
MKQVTVPEVARKHDNTEKKSSGPGLSDIASMQIAMRREVMSATSSEQLDFPSKHGDESVLSAIARSPHAQKRHLQAVLERATQPRILQNAQSHPNINAVEIDYTTAEEQVRLRRAAMDAETSEELEEASVYGDESALSAVARNPNSTAEQLLRVEERAVQPRVLKNARNHRNYPVENLISDRERLIDASHAAMQDREDSFRR